jgi:tyrosinase
MKWSKVSASAALCGATAVSALSLPQTVAKRDVDTLPLDQFGWFSTISLEDAKSGIIMSHNGSVHKIVDEVVDDLGGVASAIANSMNIVPGSQDSSSSASVSDFKATDVDTVSAAAVTCTDPNVRFEWRDYSDTDRHALVAAFQCLINAPASGSFPPATNRYEDLVRVHQMMTSTIHGNNIFLFWHRYYVWTLEQIMRDECGFDRAFPWWDETLDAGAFAASSLFTADFFGTLPGATDGQGTCITDGVSNARPNMMRA